MHTSKDGRAAPWAFLVLTLAYTWLFLGIAYLIGGDWLSFPTVLFVGLGLLGPAVVASVLVETGRSDEALRRFWARVFDWRAVSLKWYAALAVIAGAPYLAARLLQVGNSEGLSAGAPPAAFAAISVLAGVVEEPGWRGYALDSLIRRRPVLLMSFAVGAFWSTWHLPLYFIEGTFQHELGFATAAFWLLSLTIVVQSVIYAWIYVSTESLFAVVVFHILQDLGGEVFSIDGAEGIELALWAALAVAVTVLSRELILSRHAQGVERGRVVGRPSTESRS